MRLIGNGKLIIYEIRIGQNRLKDEVNYTKIIFKIDAN